jgi:hypothetical protein
MSKRIRSTPSHSIWFSSWVITADPSFICFYNSPEEVLVASVLQSAWHINTRRRRCCSSVKTRRTKSAEIRLVFKSSLRIPWHVPYQTYNLPAVSEMELRRFSLAILQTFSAFSSLRPACSQPSTEVCPRLNLAKHSKVCVLPKALSPKAVLSHSCTSDAFFLTEGKQYKYITHSTRSL